MHTVINYRSGCAALRNLARSKLRCYPSSPVRELVLPVLVGEADHVLADRRLVAAHVQRRENGILRR